VKIFHPLCEDALNQALKNLSLNSEYEVLHHQYTGTLEMDYVVRNRRTKKYLCVMGEQLKMARMRRNLTMEIVAARAQCSRQTLARLESGSPEVSVGVLARVLNALQMPDELLLIAKNDEMGKVIQDIDLKNKKRVTGK
jgi:DNA-binding XRE family transcriptional regulator